MSACSAQLSNTSPWLHSGTATTKGGTERWISVALSLCTKTYTHTQTHEPEPHAGAVGNALTSIPCSPGTRRAPPLPAGDEEPPPPGVAVAVAAAGPLSAPTCSAGQRHGGSRGTNTASRGTNASSRGTNTASRGMNAAARGTNVASRSAGGARGHGQARPHRPVAMETGLGARAPRPAPFSGWHNST